MLFNFRRIFQAALTRITIQVDDQVGRLNDSSIGKLGGNEEIAAESTGSVLPKNSLIMGAILLVIVAPLSYPGWAVEWLIRKRRRDFQFRVFSAVPYFLAVATVATTCIIWVNFPVVQGVAVYLLAVMEFIALTVCVAIAAVRMGKLHNLMLRVFRRSYSRHTLVPASSATIFAAIISGCYSVLFFGALPYVLWQGNGTFYSGISGPAPKLYYFWQFTQSSFLVFINNDGTVIAQRFISEVIWDAERIIGIFLLVFLLAVLASGWAESAFKNNASEKEIKGDEG
jgi:hypothetical protein